LVPCSSLESNIDTLADLATVVQLVTESPQWVLDVTIPNTLQWALYIIPSLRATTLEDLSNRVDHFLDQFSTKHISRIDDRDFAAYLCCLNSFLLPVDERVTVETDKRQVLKQNIHNPILIQSTVVSAHS
jgi:hypothetical protein